MQDILPFENKQGERETLINKELEKARKAVLKQTGAVATIHDKLLNTPTEGKRYSALMAKLEDASAALATALVTFAEAPIEDAA